jgi:chromosome segregation ATPase
MTVPCEPKLSNELHALQAEFQSFRGLMDERDRRYDGMFSASKTAVDAALAAQKENTQSAFVSSEKAIVKAEDAQRAYNTAHNDLARKMDEQSKGTMPRSETESRFAGAHAEVDTRMHAVEEKIAELRESMATSGGKGLGMRDMWGWILGAAVAGAMLFDKFIR